MQRAILTLGAPDPVTAARLLKLEPAAGAPVLTTVPNEHVVGTRPSDDRGNVLDPIGIRGLLLAAAPPSANELQRIGSYLHGLLAYGGVGDAWAGLRARFPREEPPDEGLRILLRVEDPDLSPLPWELVRDGPVWLFADPRNAFARLGPRYRDDAPGPSEWWPLRIAVIVGAEDDDAAVKVADEVERVQQVFGKVFPDVDPELIIRPAQADLPRKLQELKPHVLHFIGHGESGPDGGLLVMHDGETGNRWDWTVDEIVNTLAITPRIAVLNACRSGAVTAQDGTWQVADAFARIGVPAVVAMQGDIDGGAAARFAEGVYEALLEPQMLDVAVARGRQRAGLGSRDFCLPTLTLAAPLERVVPPRYMAGLNAAAIEARLPRGPMVDRTPQRRMLLERLANVNPPMLVVRGESEVGKTSLVQWTLRQLAYRGLDVAYVDMQTADETPRTQVGVLRAIRDAIQAVRPLAPGTTGSFHAWTRALNDLVTGTPPSTAPVTEPVEDLGLEFDGDPSDLAAIFRRFLDELTAAAADPLVIAVDHLEAINAADLKKDVTPNLLEPIALGNVGRLRLLVAGTAINGSLTATSERVVDVPSFAPVEVPTLVMQYLVYHDCWNDVVKKLVSGLTVVQPYKPQDLAFLLTIARKSI